MIKVHCTIYDFVSHRLSIFLLSIFVCVISLIIIVNKGFNWGLDFTGGFFVEIVSNHSFDVIKIQDSFVQLGFKKVLIQHLHKTNNIVIRVPLAHNSKHCSQKIKNEILDILHDNICHEFVVQRMTWIGPSTSKNIIKKGIISLLMSLLCVVTYITFRFKIKFAIGTIISLLFNMIIILGFLSLCVIEINSTVIAALISVIGYSLNDNIVIFDRIRENFKHVSTLCIKKVFNISLSQVLHRTIITSVTTIIVLLILLLCGGTMLYEFSVTLLIGILGGTISSIYVASLLVFVLQTKCKNFVKQS